MGNKLIVPFETVKSSQIKEIGHLGETLYIRFRNGKLYSYSPVTKEKFDEFKKAESVGSYFHKHFKMNSKLRIQKEESKI